MVHKSVLLQQAIEGLDIHTGDIFLDCTLGNGGHTEAVCKQFGKSVKVVGLDLDLDAIERSKARLAKTDCDTTFVRSSFKDLDKALDSVSTEKVDRILFDLGLSSNQFEESGRGFSFQRDEPLLMTFKKDLSENDLTAREIVNTWEEENIFQIIKGYGEERFAWKIAKKIVEEREKKAIETTADLVRIITEATPAFYHRMKIHPATRTFQALRITVNDEIESLKVGLRKGFERLKSGGRIAVISFHSLEDRIVKQYFKELATEEQVTLITKKPITPEESETEENPRSRSAKLRIILKK